MSIRAIAAAVGAFGCCVATSAADTRRVISGAGFGPGGAAALVDQAPWPAGRVDDPRRPQLGRLWLAPRPTGMDAMALATALEPGMRSYGAPQFAAAERVRVRVNGQSIVISPWTRIEGRGVNARLEAARGQWLTEQGYTQRVRTHRNMGTLRPVPSVVTRAEAPAVVPAPRGVLRVTPAPAPIDPMVMGE